MSTKKPPLGVEPRKYHAQHRIVDLARAIHEYTKAGFVTSGELRQLFKWLEELNELLHFLYGEEQKMETERLKELAPSLQMVSCGTTFEFMALTMRVLRQIYYLIYNPDGKPDMPETLMGELYKFEEELKESLGE